MNNNIIVEKSLVNGWRRNGNRIFHVEEIPEIEAESLDYFDPTEIYVVETIDWATYQFPEKETIQRKKYVFGNFKDALKFTTFIMKFYPGYSIAEADPNHREEVVALRPISFDEYCLFENVHNFMMGIDVFTPFVPDEEAKKLPDYDWLIKPV